MKNKYIFQWLCFYFLAMPLTIFAQTTRITFPINGMVFQQNGSGVANVPLSVHISGTDATNANLSTYGYYIETLDATGQVQIVPRIYRYGLTSTLQANYFRLLNETISNLPKGWYRITFGPQFISDIIPCSIIDFGVGDVYIAAGQSNASGYGGLNNSENNPVNGDERGTLQSFTNAGTAQHDAVRGMYSQYTNNPDGTGYGTLTDIPTRGLPFGIINTATNTTGFQRLSNGSAGNPQGIYPNGRDSWAWVPFANKVASEGTPVMLFNVAVPNTTMRDWTASNPTDAANANPYENTEKFQKLRSILQTFGRATGVRAILWQQGENDSKLYALRKSQGVASNYLNDYGTGLDNLIKWSRKAITGSETNTSLNWFVTKTSFNTAVSNVNWVGDPLPTALLSACIALRKDDGVNYSFPNRITSNDIRSKQQSTLGNVFDGFDSDSWAECYRSTHQRVHFSGNAKGASSNDEDGLIKMANGWHDIIFNANGTYKNASVQNNMVPGNALLTLTVTDNTPGDNNDGNYRLTAPSGYSKYFWVKDNQGIYDVAACNCPTKDITTITGTPEYWTCYISNANDADAVNGWDLPDLKVTQTFISRNATDAISRGLRFSTNDISYPANSIDQQVTVISNSVVWDVINKPDWTLINTNLGGFGETPVRITTQANSTGFPRTGPLTLRDRGGIIADQTLNINQSANTGCTQTNLTSLTPTNPSGEWQGYGTRQLNKSIDGNTLMVGGFTTGNGIGTHANSTMVYNLSGQYGTFSGSVGRDDEADNCGCGNMKLQFIIMADGATLFTSSLLGTTDARQAFSVDVTGKNTLELIVNDGGDNFYGDHADWLDPVLYCGAAPSCTTAPSAPTNVSSSPATISSGGSSTLSATCATGTVTWSTGAVGNSISVSPTVSTNYSVSCVSGTCPPSNTVSIGVTVNTGACSAISDGLVMGTWNATGQQLVARFFNGQFWLTQRTGSNPDGFVVRGSGMLQRSDVSLANGSYYNLVGCFSWTYSNYDNLGNPPSSVFSTPAGYSLGYAQDGTMFYTATTGGGGGGGSCTDAYVTNAWASATIGYGSTPQIGYRFDGGAMVMGGTTYTQGIGTHAGSEIIYNFTNNPYANFKASVGRDVDANGCNCPAGSGQTIVFKVYNNTTGALISGTNNPVTKGINQGASDMVVPIAGVASIRLVVEDGGDQIWGDHANWGNARFTCANSNGRESVVTAEEWFWVSPNPNNGKFVAKVILKSKQSVQLYLSNIQGNIINEYSFVGVEGENSFEINISNIQDQIYNLRCQVGEESSSKRVVIEK